MHSTSTRSNSLRLGLAYAELLNSHQRLHTIPVLITMENTKLNIIPSFISFFSFQKEERSNWNYIKLRSPMPSISYWDIYFGTIKNVFHALILFWILKQFMIYKNFEIEMLKSRFSGLLGLSASTKMYKRNPPKKKTLKQYNSTFKFTRRSLRQSRSLLSPLSNLSFHLLYHNTESQ